MEKRIRIKNMQIRLGSKVTKAFENIYDPQYKNRIKKLEKVDEYSFAILIYWNIVEALLKVLKYYDKIDQEYPDKLNFISRRWRILKYPSINNSEYYKLILGSGKKTANCLWGIRDRIVHANHEIEEDKYKSLKEAVIWLIGALRTNLPDSKTAARQQFLQHKKKKVGRNKKQSSSH
jgi:hypothetical protein